LTGVGRGATVPRRRGGGRGLEYGGRYPIFDPSGVRTYPLRQRANKVRAEDLVDPAALPDASADLGAEPVRLIGEVADRVVAARRAKRAVVVFTGAHPIKNGLGPLLVDWIGREVVTLVAMTGAGAIHDFELALIGQTSENVPDALPEGRFGMAYEFAYWIEAVNVGHRMRLGLGESLGRMICDTEFRSRVLASVGREDSPKEFAHPQGSVLAAAHAHGVPVTVHATIGADVVDQHPNFDAAAMGGASGRDFLIFVQEVTRLAGGGVVLNLGSAVTGPEVLLKAVSMAANVGKAPTGLVTAVFDLRPYAAGARGSEDAAGYYFRDQKSVVERIPAAFGGRGTYVQGHHKLTLVALHRAIAERLG
jgi:hypothetical protein